MPTNQAETATNLGQVISSRRIQPSQDEVCSVQDLLATKAKYNSSKTVGNMLRVKDGVEQQGGQLDNRTCLDLNQETSSSPASVPVANLGFQREDPIPSHRCRKRKSRGRCTPQSQTKKPRRDSCADGASVQVAQNVKQVPAQPSKKGRPSKVIQQEVVNNMQGMPIIHTHIANLPEEGVCWFCQEGPDSDAAFGLGDLEASGYLISSNSGAKSEFRFHETCSAYCSGHTRISYDGRIPMKDIVNEWRRGCKMQCCICRKYGAVLGCAERKCRKSYHYTCARRAVLQSKVVFHKTDRTMACSDHVDNIPQEERESVKEFRGLWLEKQGGWKMEYMGRTSAARMMGTNQQWHVNFGNHLMNKIPPCSKGSQARSRRRNSAKRKQNQIREWSPGIGCLDVNQHVEILSSGTEDADKHRPEQTQQNLSRKSYQKSEPKETYSERKSKSLTHIGLQVVAKDADDVHETENQQQNQQQQHQWKQVSINDFVQTSGRLQDNIECKHEDIRKKDSLLSTDSVPQKTKSSNVQDSGQPSEQSHSTTNQLTTTTDSGPPENIIDNQQQLLVSQNYDKKDNLQYNVSNVDETNDDRKFALDGNISQQQMQQQVVSSEEEHNCKYDSQNVSSFENDQQHESDDTNVMVTDKSTPPRQQIQTEVEQEATLQQERVNQQKAGVAQVEDKGSQRHQQQVEPYLDFAHDQQQTSWQRPLNSGDFDLGTSLQANDEVEQALQHIIGAAVDKCQLRDMDHVFSSPSVGGCDVAKQERQQLHEAISPPSAHRRKRNENFLADWITFSGRASTRRRGSQDQFQWGEQNVPSVENNNIMESVSAHPYNIISPRMIARQHKSPPVVHPQQQQVHNSTTNDIAPFITMSISLSQALDNSANVVKSQLYHHPFQQYVLRQTKQQQCRQKMVNLADVVGNSNDTQTPFQNKNSQSLKKVSSGKFKIKFKRKTTTESDQTSHFHPKPGQQSPKSLLIDDNESEQCFTRSQSRTMEENQVDDCEFLADICGHSKGLDSRVDTRHGHHADQAYENIVENMQQKQYVNQSGDLLYPCVQHCLEARDGIKDGMSVGNLDSLSRRFDTVNIFQNDQAKHPTYLQQNQVRNSVHISSACYSMHGQNYEHGTKYSHLHDNSKAMDCGLDHNKNLDLNHSYDMYNSHCIEHTRNQDDRTRSFIGRKQEDSFIGRSSYYEFDNTPLGKNDYLQSHRLSSSVKPTLQTYHVSQYGQDVQDACHVSRVQEEQHDYFSDVQNVMVNAQNVEHEEGFRNVPKYVENVQHIPHALHLQQDVNAQHDTWCDHQPVQLLSYSSEELSLQKQHHHVSGNKVGYVPFQNVRVFRANVSLLPRLQDGEIRVLGQTLDPDVAVMYQQQVEHFDRMNTPLVHVSTEGQDMSVVRGLDLSDMESQVSSMIGVYELDVHNTKLKLEPTLRVSKLLREQYKMLDPRQHVRGQNIVVAGERILKGTVLGTYTCYVGLREDLQQHLLNCGVEYQQKIIGYSRFIYDFHCIGLACTAWCYGSVFAEIKDPNIQVVKNDAISDHYNAEWWRVIGSESSFMDSNWVGRPNVAIITFKIQGWPVPFVVSIRDIQQGEELRYVYGLEHWNRVLQGTI